MKQHITKITYLRLFAPNVELFAFRREYLAYCYAAVPRKHHPEHKELAFRLITIIKIVT